MIREIRGENWELRVEKEAPRITRITRIDNAFGALRNNPNALLAEERG